MVPRSKVSVVPAAVALVMALPVPVMVRLVQPPPLPKSIRGMEFVVAVDSTFVAIWPASAALMPEPPPAPSSTPFIVTEFDTAKTLVPISA